jgi:O-antigen/teichoic acid export membrane protein
VILQSQVLTTLKEQWPILSAIMIVLKILLFLAVVVGLCLILVFYLFIIYFNDYRNYKNIYHEKVVFKGKKQDLYNIIILGLPLGIVLLIISLNANVSKYFLEIYSGTEKQAIFSAISYILVIGLFILDSLGQSFVPRLSRYFYERNFKNFKNLTIIFVGLSLLIGTTLFVFSLFFGKVGLQFLFNEKISEYSGFLSQYLSVCILVFIASSLGYTLTSMGEFNVQPIINLVILLVNLVLSFFLIKKYELFGVIIVLGICFLLQIIITTYLIMRKISKIQKTD